LQRRQLRAATRKREEALLVEHISDAGSRHQNPGENFVELRWARHFD
jgi:hypothetical protein